MTSSCKPAPAARSPQVADWKTDTVAPGALVPLAGSSCDQLCPDQAAGQGLQSRSTADAAAPDSHACHRLPPGWWRADGGHGWTPCGVPPSVHTPSALGSAASWRGRGSGTLPRRNRCGTLRGSDHHPSCWVPLTVHTPRRHHWYPRCLSRGVVQRLNFVWELSTGAISLCNTGMGLFQTIAGPAEYHSQLTPLLPPPVPALCKGLEGQGGS